jgi:hypothetical protein
MLRFGNEIVLRGCRALLLMLLAFAPGAQAGGQFVPAGDMTTPRGLHGAAALDDGHVLVVGGIADFGVIVATAELYDPATDTFSLTGAPADARSRPTVVGLADGRVLIVGGRGGEDGSVYFSSAEIYDPATGQFSPTGDTTVPRYVASAALLEDGTVLIAGGFNRSDGALSSAERYDPATGQFTATGGMAGPRIQTLAVVRLADGRVLIAGGGNDSGPLASAEIYDPVSGTFSATGDLPEPRDGHAAVLLPDGKVLVVGGSDGGLSGFPDYRAAAALYDPATGQFTSTGSLAYPRDQSRASLLPDGRVLVAGGSHLAGEPGSVTVATAEIYDPESGTFSIAGDLVVPRDDPAAVTLPDHSILLIGGWAFAGDTVGDLPTATAERFVPALPDIVFADGFDGAVPISPRHH